MRRLYIPAELITLNLVKITETIFILVTNLLIILIKIGLTILNRKY